MTKTIAIYARTPRTEEEFITQQIEQCSNHARVLYGDTVTIEQFVDRGVAANQVKPSFNLLMEAVTRGEVDAVVTRDFTRISRRVDAMDIICYFLDHGTEFVSVQDQGVIGRGRTTI